MRGFAKAILAIAIVGSVVSPLAVNAEVSAEPLAPIAHPEQMQLRHFAVLHTPSEPIPPKQLANLEKAQQAVLESSHISPSMVPMATSNYSLAQRVDIRGQSQSVHSVWVVPAQGYLTLMNIRSGHASGFPATTRQVIRRGLLRKQFGLVPDGVIAVRLNRTLSAPVHENFYSVQADPATIWAHPKLIHGASATHAPK